MKQITHHLKPYELEALEARIMLSGDLADVLVGGSGIVVQEVIRAQGDPQDQDTLTPVSGELTPAEVLEVQSELFVPVAGGGAADEEAVLLEGTLDADLELSAGVVELGDSVWSGHNVIFADRLNITGTLTALPGATLTIAPRDPDADILLGDTGPGFELNEEEMLRLSDASFTELIIGQETGSHDHYLRGFEYQGNLTLRAPAVGGEFHIEEEIRHSGGTLTFLGSGNTQNTSQDTITEGNDIAVNDSVQLIYLENSGNFHGDNTILMDTTDGGNFSDGNNISITGDILGTSEGRGGILYLNAGNKGDIFISGNIGTSVGLEGIVILNANNVTVDGNIQVDFLTQQDGTLNTTLGSTSANFVRILDGDFDLNTGANITVNGDLELVDGNANIVITGVSSTYQFDVKGSTTVSNGNLNIIRAGKVMMGGPVSVSGAITQTTGLSDSTFQDAVTTGSMNLRADTRILFENTLTLTQGDLTLVTNNIDFTGGASSVNGALDGNNLSISNAFFRPIAADVDMNIGAPQGATSLFPFTSTDIAALTDGWASITFGYDTGATNLARIGNAAFLDEVTVYAGSIFVNRNHSARTGLTLEAATGDISVTNGAQVRVQNEQTDNVWGSSAVTLTADAGDVLFNNGAHLQIDNNDDADTVQGSAITIVSTLGQVRDQSATANFHTARDLTVTAAEDIYLFTAVENLWAESTSDGDISVFELDGLHVYKAITANGAILIDTGGLTRVDLVSSLTDATLNTATVSALDDIEVGRILAGTQGDVTLTAEGQIRRIAGLADNDHLVQGNELDFTAEDGVGEAAIPLLIQANGLNTVNSLTGLIRIEQIAGRGTLGVSIDQNTTGASDMVSLVADVDTAVTVRAAGIHSDSAAGIFLSVLADLILNGSITTQGGSITLLAETSTTLNAGTAVESNGSDILIESGRNAIGDLTLAVDAAVRSLGGNILVAVSQNTTLGILDARSIDLLDAANWGGIDLQIGGWLRDHSASATVNLLAYELKIATGTGIGQLPVLGDEQTVEIDAVLLSAGTATDGVIVLADQNDLTVGEVGLLPASLILVDGSILGHPGYGAQTAVVNSFGGDILLSAAAALTLDTDVAVQTQGTGRIALIAGSLTANGDVLSQGGDLSINISGEVTLNNGALIQTTGTGSVALRSDTGSVLSAADTRIESSSGPILIQAENDLTLGQVSTTGAAGLTAVTGFLRSAAGGVDSRIVVTADSLALVVGDLVDGPDATAERFHTSVNALSLTGGTGTRYRIENDQALTIDTTAALADLYNSLMVASDLEVTAQSDVDVSGEGDIELIVRGDTVLAGTRDISTTGAGLIDLTADGAFTMRELALITNQTGAVNLTAQNTISVGRIHSDSGDITVKSLSASIVDSDPAQTTVRDFETAGQLDLRAVNGIGIESSIRHTLTVALGTLRAETATGGIFISSPSGYATNGILTTGGTTPVSLLSGGTVKIGPNAGGVAITATGDIVVQVQGDIVQLPSSSITSGTDIALSANAVDGDITLFSVTAASGSVALSAGGAVMGIATPVLPAISALGLLLDDVGSFGTPAQRVITAVGRLAGTIDAGTVAFDNQISLTLGSVTVVTTEPLQTGFRDPLPTESQTADRLQVSGVDGDGVFAVVTGSLTVTAADAGLSTLAVGDTLPVLWQSSQSQTWNGWFALDGGDLTLRSNQNLALNGTTTSTTAGGHVAIETTGDVSTHADTALNFGSGDLVAQIGETGTIDGQWITSGSIAIVAGDSILAGLDSTAVRLTASDLLLNAPNAVGAEDSVLVTAVSQMAVASGYAGVHIDNTGDLRITNLGWTVPSLQPNADVNLIFSGYLGGVTTTQSGAIMLINDGIVIVDPVAARIQAFGEEPFQIALLADETGPAGNELSVLFDVTNTVVDVETDFDSEQGLLRVRIPQGGGLSVLDVINAINADSDFPATAILGGGPVGGTQTFVISAGGENQFDAEGGSLDGVATRLYGTTAGGEEPIAALATIQPLEEQYTIQIRALNPGEAANNFTARILDAGPDTALIDGLDIAIVEWDDLNEQLNLYVNYGYTTFDTLVRTINQATNPSISPFTAQFSGSYSPANDSGDVIGVPSVLMESSLLAEATLRPLGPNNDIRVEANGSGGLYNGIQFRFIDDGLAPVLGVRTTFDPNTNIFSVFLQSGVSTANQVVNAINLGDVFSASLVPETASFNNGNGIIQASRFILAGGAVGVKATTHLEMIGSNNNVILTADEPGDDQNGIVTRIVIDPGLGLGEVTATYSALDAELLLTLSPSGASAIAVLEAINLGPNAASIPLTASLPSGQTGSGTLSITTYPLTAGGTGALAQATLDGVGDNNTIFFEADRDVPSLVNITVRLIDDGTITGGTATVTYTDSPRRLLINMQAGVTTAQTIITTLNEDAGIEITAYNANGSDGSGTFGLADSQFVGGVDPAIPALTHTLPSGLALILVSTTNWEDTSLVGGIAENGIEVTLAVDDSLPTGSVAVERLEIDTRRILFIRVADASVTVQNLHDALTNSGANFEIGNLVNVAGESLLPLGPVRVDGQSTFNEGSIRVHSDGDMQLIGRVESAAGRVELTTTVGDLSLESAEARIFGVDGVALDVAGSFANRASVEAFQVLVLDQEQLFIKTGSQALVSTESIALRGHGDILITGAGLAIEDGFEVEQILSLDANGEITVDAPIRSVSATLTANGLVFKLVKSLVDADDNPLSEADSPVSISEDSGTYTMYALPGVATHADIIDAINALEIDDLNLFFASLGRQEGLLSVGDFSFYLTVLEGGGVNIVNIEFAELAEGNALASLANGFLTLQLSPLDNTTAADVLAALNALDEISATSTDAVLTGFARGAEARDFDSDYSIEIVPDTTLSIETPVVLSEVDGVFSLRALPGVATRLDLRDAFIDSGLFGVLIPSQTALLRVDGIDYFLNTGTDVVTDVDLEFRSVGQESTLPGLVDLSSSEGTITVALDIFNPTTAADLQSAFENFGYTVFTTTADLDVAFDEATTTATLETIAANEGASALTLGETTTATLPVAADGVFAGTLIEVEGLLMLVNWDVPTLNFDYEVLTAPENRGGVVVDDAAVPQTTLNAGSEGVFSSAVLLVDGVEIALRARSAELALQAGGSITITENGLLGGGVVRVDAGNEGIVDGVIEGGPIDVRAEAAITQTGLIQAVGTGEIRVESHTSTITMSDPASTTSESGDILYEAPGDIALTFIDSTNTGRIDIVSGAAIIDATAATTNSLNVQTDGFVTLTAQTGIGSILNGDIKTAVGSLRLRNIGSTGDSVITQIALGGDLDITEITQNAFGGWSILTVEFGNLTLSGPVSHISDGSLVISVIGNVAVEDTIDLQGGEFTLGAMGDATFEADISTNVGDVAVFVLGAIRMDPLMSLDAAGGNVLLQANDNVLVSAVISADADVRIESTAASVLRADADGRTNVTARTLQLEAGVAIGSLDDASEAITTDVSHLNATATTGVLAVHEDNELTVVASEITVRYAQNDKSTITDTWNETQLLTGNGDAVLTTGGTLTIEGETLPTVSIIGSLHIAVSNSTEDSDGDLLIDGDIFVNGGTLLVEVDGFITQAAASEILVTDADAILAAGGAINIARINTGTGALALTAGGVITRVTGAPAVQITAQDLRLESGADIGAVDAAISFDADTLSALAVGSIHLNGASSVAVTAVEVSAQIPTPVPPQVLPALRTEAAQSDLTSIGGGDILVQIAGRLELFDGDSDTLAVSTLQNGHIFLRATNLDVYAAIVNADGHQTLDIAQALEFHHAAESAPAAGDGYTGSLLTQTGDIHVTAVQSITMQDLTSIRSAQGNVRLDSEGIIRVGRVEATLGLVALRSTLGQILDNGDSETDVIADKLHLIAELGVGLLGAGYNALETQVNRIAALVVSGPFAVSNTGAIEVGDISGETVATVNLGGIVGSVVVRDWNGIQSFDELGSGVSLTASGDITVLDDGTMDPGIRAAALGTGNLHLSATGTGSTLTLSDDLVAAAGHITLLADGLILMDENVTVETFGPGTITVDSANGGFTQNTGSTLAAQNGNILVEAQGTVALSGITTAGSVAVTSLSGAILDNESARTNVEANALRLNAALNIAAGANPLNVDVVNLTAATADGGLFVQGENSLTVSSVEVITQQVEVNASTSPITAAAQTGLGTGGNGSIVARAMDGHLTVQTGNAVSATSSGNILLEASANVSVNEAVSSDSGNITIRSGADMTFAAGVIVSTASVGEILALSDGALTAGANSRFSAATGNVGVGAATNVVLGGISTQGNVFVASAFGTIRGAGSTDFTVEVEADHLLLTAPQGGVGTLSPDTPIRVFRTRVNRLAASAGPAGVHVVNETALEINTVSVPASLVTPSGTLEALPSAPLSNLTTLSGNGPVVVQTLSGSLTLHEPVSVHGSGNLRLDAADDLIVNEAITSGTGHLTLRAVNDISFSATGSVTTAAPGTVLLLAENGSIGMNALASITATGSAVRLHAETNITLGSVAGGDISLVSESSAVLRASGSIMNLTANNLRIEAAANIGSSNAHLTTTVDTLSAQSGTGSIYITETDDISIGGVTVTVQEVSLTAATSPVTDSLQSGLATLANGNIVLVSSTGAVTVSPGAAVSANGLGNIRLAAATQLLISETLSSGTGHITLLAGNGLTVSETIVISTAAPGSVYLDAGTGDLILPAAGGINAPGGPVRLGADGDIHVGLVTGQNVWIRSDSASILPVGVAAVNISTASLSLFAGDLIAAGLEPLRISASTLSARSANGIWLRETDNIIVNQTFFPVIQVGVNGVAVSSSPAAQSDLVTTANGDIVLVSGAGSITLSDGNANLSAVSAGGSGSVLLQAATSISANAAAGVRSGTGNLALHAGTVLTLGAVTVETAAPGDISLQASAGNLVMEGQTIVRTPGGSLRVFGRDDVLLGNLTAESVSVTSQTSFINNPLFTTRNITAANVRLRADDEIGLLTRRITLDAGVLTAESATAGIFLSELNDVTIGSVAVTANEIDADGQPTSQTDAAQAGLVALANGSINLLASNGTVSSLVGSGSISANGTGEVRIAAASIDLDGDVTSDTGLITLRSTTGDLAFIGFISTAANVALQSAAALTGGTVEADSARLTADGSVGSLLQPVQVDVTTLAADSATGGVYLHGLTDMTLGAASVDGLPVLTALSAATEIVLTSVASVFSGTADPDLTAPAVQLDLIGSAGTAADPLRLVSDTLAALSTTGDFFMIALGDVEIGTLNELSGLTAQSGSVYLGVLGQMTLNQNTTAAQDVSLHGESGMSMGSNAQVSGDRVRIASPADLQLAQVNADHISLVAGGALLSGNIQGGTLRILSQQDVGTAVIPVRTEVEALSAVSVLGAVYLTAAGNTSLAEAGMDIQAFITLSETFTNVEDALQHGVSAAGDIELTTFSGRWLDGGDTEDDIRTPTGSVTLTGADGLGTVGAGALEISAPALNASTGNGGSAYLNLTRTTEVQNISLGGQGHLYLQVSGDLDQTGSILVPQGSAFITVTESYLGSGLLQVSRELRLVAADAALTADAEILSSTGDIQLRFAGDLLMAPGAHVHALLGTLRVVTGGNLTSGLLEAVRILDLRIGGDLRSASTVRATHELRAAALRLVVKGTIEPILTRTGRLDVRAGGVQEIYEYDSLTAGRFGFKLEEPAAKDEFILRMGTGVLDSLRENITVQDDVVFVLLSDTNGVVTQATPIVLPEGDLRIEVDGLALDPDLAGVMLSAALGDVILYAGNGVGTEGQRIVVDAATFNALAQSGRLFVRFVTPVEIGAAGVEIQSGGNAINLLVEGGSITLGGELRHLGNGTVRVEAPNGGLSVPVAGSAAKISTGERIALNLSTGVTVAGGNRLNISSGSLTAITQSGNLRLNLMNTTQIATEGVHILGGGGVLDLRVAVGNLNMAAEAWIRNLGGGGMNIQVENGALSMLASSRIHNENSALILTVRNNLTVGRIISRGNATNLTSTLGSILRAAGSSGADLELRTYGDHAPVINFATTSDLWLGVNVATVNGNVRIRVSDQPFLVLP